MFSNILLNTTTDLSPDFFLNQMVSNSAFSLFSGTFVIFLIFALILAGFYVYLSLAFYNIGKKAGMTSPGIAWFPGFGMLSVIYQSSKKHWWPFPTIIGSYILSFVLVFLSAIVFSRFLVIFTSIFMSVIGIIWTYKSFDWLWHTYENAGKPGYWSVIPLGIFILAILSFFIHPILAALLIMAGSITFLVIIGLVAWKD